MSERYNPSFPGSKEPASALSAKEHDGIGCFLDLPISSLVSKSNAGIFVTDSRDQLIWANDILYEHPFMGPEIKVVLNKPAIYVIKYLQAFVVYPSAFALRIHELIANRKPFFGEKIPLRNGTTIRVDYMPVFYQNEFYGAVWQFVQISKKKEKQQPRYSFDRSFTGLLDKLHIAFCEINEKGQILHASPFFCRFTGYYEKELLKVNFLDLCLSGKSHLTESIKNIDSGLLAKDTVSFEMEIKLRDDAKWVQCHTFNKVRELGVGSGCILFMTEITEQKGIQRELEEARRIAEEAQLAQQQFLASMSHDIRTPLNTIIGMTLLIADTPLNTEQKEYVKIVKNASYILLDLLNGILDFAKIESGRQEVRQSEFDLPALLRSLIETFSFKLNEKSVDLHCEIDPRIKYMLVGDSTLLNQILMNLLANAEKFTAKGEIRLKASILKEFDNNVWIEFRVEDTGIGISKDKLETIFHDFIQADEDIRSHYGGSGLGLFICKRLIEMMGGKVVVESVEGKGTVFTFSLPFATTRKMTTPEKKEPFSPTAFNMDDTSLLIVEDNPMNLKYLSTLLTRNAFKFDIATDGLAALEMSRLKYYNLILMDIKLPKMEGLEVTQHIRMEADNPNAASPVVLVSAEAFQSTLDKAKEAGVNELLTKPYTPEQLLNILEKYLVEEEQEEAGGPDEDQFRFDDKLDRVYLQKLYSGNCNYAVSLFDVFLESTEQDWAQVEQSMRAEDWTQLKNQVHKIKPNFSMVGLTKMTEKMQHIYDKLKDEEYETAVSLLEDMQTDMDENIPLIESEAQRMRQYLLSRKFPE